MVANFNFPKKEKLKSVKDIDVLFKKGKSIHQFPFRLIYLEKQEKKGVPINFGVSVPKKKIKLAVTRNLIKRRVREAYRLNNKELKAALLVLSKELNVMLIYGSDKILSFHEIEDKIKVILYRLKESCEVDSK